MGQSSETLNLQSVQLLKHNLAAAIRDEILQGKLAPGESIVEAKWAAKFNVAQGTIREAINLLVLQGFVHKEPNRTARVTILSSREISQIYQVRAVLEGLAARLAAEVKPDLSEVDQVLADMQAAVECRNIQAFYHRDVQFHCLIAAKSGNEVLAEEIKRLVAPLFAFTLIRIYGQNKNPDLWQESVAKHRAMLEVIRNGDPAYAERGVASIISQFHTLTVKIEAET